MYLCPPGYYCPDMAMVNYKGYPCEKGHYCPAGSISATEEPCPAGTYSDRYSLHDPLDCERCPKGYTCSSGATTANGNVAACPANLYCPEGTSQGSEPKCPTGTHNPSTGGYSLEDCQPCPYGSFCAEGAGAAACPVGHYCPESTNSTDEFPCPEGTYRDTPGAVDIQQCRPCGLGKFCTEASVSPGACGVGTYNDFSNMAAECKLCPAGYECPETSGTIHAAPCERGSYSELGAAACTYCPPGHFCPELAMTNETMLVDRVCDAGLLCVNTTKLDGAAALGSTAGLAVWPNNDDHGCAAGHYCPRGATAQIACEPGTYNPARARKTENDCLVSEAGQYVSTSGASTTTGYCDPGHYCPPGSISATRESVLSAPTVALRVDAARRIAAHASRAKNATRKE